MSDEPQKDQSLPPFPEDPSAPQALMASLKLWLELVIYLKEEGFVNFEGLAEQMKGNNRDPSDYAAVIVTHVAERLSNAHRRDAPPDIRSTLRIVPKDEEPA